MRLSIIIPALNEAANIAATLAPLQPMRARGVEVIVVDGGSSDATRSIAAPLADSIVDSPRGRATQMNAGARAAIGDTFLFLHADSLLPANADELIGEALSRPRKNWGRFDVVIDGGHFMFPIIAWFMNHRSCLTGIATGDQGIFVKRETFEKLGGFPEQPLMEDVELSDRLRRESGPACVSAAKIHTSGRRWEKHGVWRTIFLMWRLRWNYHRGASAESIHRAYYGK
ncbi:MAG: TIGR04283 family arsenosugar biosynthesis glycosyltransferase [Betaproteobacteria bacterium]|nr:TIGR04283 family arsenosugar biosynthesis glycosyltransferase [Betaproteobacteria bacterium]